jgi:hypothetical protein
MKTDMTTVLKRTLQGLGLAAVMLPMAVAAAIPSAERLLPADTLAVISTPSYSQLREIYAKSPLGQLLYDPAMKPIREKFISKWKEEFVEPLERELGVKLQDYDELLQGQITFAVTQNGWQGRDDQEPAFLLLLDTVNKQELLKTNLAGLRQKWVDSGKSIKTETIRGTDFWIVQVTSNNVPDTLQKFFPHRQEIQEKGRENEPAREGGNELVIGQHESLLIVGTSTKGVDQIMAQLTGGSVPALADEAAFEADRNQLFRAAPLFAWANAKRIIDVVLSLPTPEPNPEAPSPLPPLDVNSILKATGLAGLKTLALTWHSTAEGSGCDFFMGVPESTRAGLFKILAVDAKDSSPPAFVPSDALKFQRWRLDGQKAVATLEKMAGEISPQALSVWNFFINTGNEAGKASDPSFDLRRDLFGNLGDDIISYSKVPRGDTPVELNSPPSLILIASPDADKMAASLKGLLAIVSPTTKPTEREFLGKKIYTVPVASTLLGTAGLRGRTLSCSASRGYLALSSDTALLEEYLRSSENPPKPLRELPGLAEAAQKVGGQDTGLFNYEDQAAKMRITFQLLKASTGKSDNEGGSSLMAGSVPFASPEKSFKEWVDFSLLPDFDTVSKYFSFEIYSANTTPDGITYKFFSPTPRGLK